MRFQGTLLPAASTADELRWRWTPASAAIGDAAVVALAEVGLNAELELMPNDQYDDEQPKQAADGGREDVYLEVRLVDSEASAAICDGGGFVVADSFEGSEQDQHREFVLLVRAIERVSGWRLAERDERSLTTAAAHYGVGPDGRIEVPAQITEDELAAALVRLAPRFLTQPDRPRPPELLDSPALRELASMLAAGASAHLLPAHRVYELSDREVGTMGEVGEQVWQSDVDDDADLFALWHQLGDDETGRPTQVRIDVDARREWSTTISFDVLPGDPAKPEFDYSWEGRIVTMLERLPEWMPPWLPDAAALLRAAGRGVTLPSSGT
jgi:hypothetical protein